MHNFYYTYKIICLKGSFAGHYYLGQHKTNDLNDETRDKMRKNKQGRHWIVDPETNKRKWI